MGLHTATPLNHRVKGAGERTVYAGRFNIGPRLILGFVFIILSMLAADAVLLWQFQLVRTEAVRLNGVDQKLIAVQRVYTSLLVFHDRLEELADSQDVGRLVTEGGSLRTAVLEDTRRAISALSLPPSVPQRNPTILPTLHVIQSALPSQLETITTLAKSGDWRAVHLRLANEVTPLETMTSTLVENVDHEVGEEQTETVRNMERVQRLVFLMVPLTALVTLLIAATLGVAITRSITQPLARLVEGSKALARGEFQHQVAVTGNDELAHVGRVFNDTAWRLQDLYATLQRSEDRLRLVIDTIPAHVWSARPDGCIDFFNRRWLETTGLSMEHARDWDWGSVIHPDDLTRYVDEWRAALATGEPTESEVRARGADGKYRWWLTRCVPLRDELGNIVNWYGTAIDIEERHRAEDALRRSEVYLAEAQRLSHTGSYAGTPGPGEIRYWSEECYRMLGFDPHKGLPSVEAFFQRFHPDDRAGIIEELERAAREKTGFEFDYRIVHPGGGIREIHTIGHPVFSPTGDLVEYVGTVIDITEGKRAEALRDGESRILEMIARDAPLEESLEQLVRVVEAQFANLLCSILLLDEDGQHVRHGAAPNLPKPYVKAIDGLCIGPKAGSCGTAMYRREPVVVTDILQDPLWEAYRSVVEPYGFRACWSTPILAHSGKTLGSFAMYYREPRSPSPAETHALTMATHLAGIAIERKRAEETLRASEAYLAEAQRMTRCGSWAWNVPTGAIFWSQETFRIYECDPEKTTLSWSYILERVHPEDRPGVEQRAKRESTRKDTVNSEGDFRIVFPDGRIKHLHSIAHPVINAAGEITEVIGTTLDITERKQAEEKIRQSERELRQLIDLTPLHITELGPDGTPLYNNKAALDYHGLTLEQWKTSAWDRLLHPQDAERVASEVPGKFQSGSPYEIEARFRRKDGQYRWFVFRFNPIRDEKGRLIRWYAAATDIEDRKQAEQQLQNENVALREEIDKASMFEEIVGSSPALYSVLSLLSKVAPTDSTVLITGETGTGKELVARAVHKRSQRCSRAFVSVNCAAIPRDLIASELFGHEKGAFTGATQRRLGRFELAEGGTIFLDEVGELPAETQIALLRVLQEHEFERVGGTASIRANVRVIAATNRDLKAAIAAGTFRSDLFYRLNVFPIKVPPLRERQEDIPMLVEYFIDRYASSAGKSIRGVTKRSLDLLQSYPWPGNIRELQNVIERSVIVCDSENFSVDESWLSRQPLQSEPKSQVDLSGKLATQEKEIIETALRECGGRVSGPSGAAAKLGLPGSTLDSKIKTLKINKGRFKTSDPSEDRI